MKRILVFLGSALLIVFLVYPFASELLQRETVKQSRARFEKTVLESTRGQSNPVKQGNARWRRLPGTVREQFDRLGLYPATLSEGARHFELQSLSGKTVSLADYRGEWVVLNFWATWCPPCRLEMPSLDQLNESFREEKLSVLTVNVQQTRPTIRQFKRNYGFELPVLLDTTGAVSKRYGVVGLPETWLIHPDGQPVAKIEGPLDWHSETVLDGFDELLNSDVVPGTR